MLRRGRPRGEANRRGEHVGSSTGWIVKGLQHRLCRRDRGYRKRDGEENGRRRREVLGWENSRRHRRRRCGQGFGVRR